ncbi:MAG: hypothetical protein A2Y17_01875 [Clostridiales bacterium GWF2_38_85]|nr:MAG: hypothetical protein A2Y17_01875 [Clostridiales bacterium GWF2_38_85]
MKNYKGTLLKHDKQFFIDRYIGILKLKDYHFSKLQLYIDYGDYLWDKVKLLPTGYCHGDMHYGNLLKTNYNEYILLDFDTSCYAYPMFDITLMCDATNYFELTPEEYDNSQKTYERFLNGYQKYRTINNDEYNSFYNWIAIRHFQLQATLVEVFGVNCINENYIDDQLDWLTQWINLCEKNR